MMKLLLSTLTLAFAEAATRVAVIELGHAGIVRRTNAVSETTSVEGVASFWGVLHGHGRKLQHSGMTVVPDLFSRPDDGLVVAISGVDMENMPTVSSLMTEEGANGVVGHMEMSGSHCAEMLKRLQTVEAVDGSSLVTTAKKHAEEAGLSGLKLEVTSENAGDVDAQIGTLLESMRRLAKDSGKNIVLHVVVEETEGAASRRRLTRRLEDQGDQENAANNGGQQFGGYYGYGFYNAYGEWVSDITFCVGVHRWIDRLHSLLTLRLLNHCIQTGYSIQDHVPNPIFQRCLVDIRCIVPRMFLRYLFDDQHATNARYPIVWRVSTNGNSRLSPSIYLSSRK
jgi:hypothetical protein